MYHIILNNQRFYLYPTVTLPMCAIFGFKLISYLISETSICVRELQLDFDIFAIIFSFAYLVNQTDDSNCIYCAGELLSLPKGR